MEKPSKLINNKLQNSKEIWIESTLKLEYIIKQMLNLGFIPDDHLDWIKPMFESINIPDVSINIKNKYVPTVQDNEIIDDGDESEQIERLEYLSDEASYFSELIGESINHNLAINRDNTLNSIIKIQSFFRKYLAVNKYNLITKGNIEEKKKSAIIIQKHIRGYKTNSIQKISNEVYEYFYKNNFSRTFNSVKTNITFVNSSTKNIEVAFINNRGIVRNKYIIKGFNQDKIENNIFYNKRLSTYTNHKFSIIGSNINHNIRISSFHKINYVYDVYSGLSFTKEDWKKIIQNKYPEYFNIYISHWKETPMMSEVIDCVVNNLMGEENNENDTSTMIQMAIINSFFSS